MNMDLLKKLGGKFRPESIKDFLESVEKIEKIVNDLNRVRKQKQQLTTEYEQKIIKLNQEEYSITKQCSHTLTKHHSDPAGGSDNYRECEICGAQV